MVRFRCTWCPFEEWYDNPPRICPKCESKSYTLTFGREKPKEEFVNITSEDHPRYSDALGVNPDQIPAFKKQFGDLVDFDGEGRCLVKNRQHKRQLLKARGMVELD